ncbi:MAG TPA: hypothetical protein VF457_10900 [Burkholderiaceae bacterium]
MTKPRITWSDRLVAAALCAVFAALTLLVFPVVLLVATRDRTLVSLQLFRGFHVWAPIVVGLAAACGFVAGGERSTDLLAHWWGTARPRRPGITLGMWAVVLVIALAVNLLGR